MVQEDKRYYHVEYCHDRWKRDKEATRIENQQWDDLYQYIIKLHDIIVLPKGNITRLKDLRAGFDTKNGKRERKWRTGPDFLLMLEAYKLAEAVNHQSITGKTADWSDVNKVNYTISTMVGYLNDAWSRRQYAQKQKQAAARVETQESHKDQSLKSKNTYSNKEDELDISDFL
jgi:hypothetical protein